MIEKIKTLLGIPADNTSHDAKISLILELALAEFPFFRKEKRAEKFYRKNIKNSIIPISFPFLQKILEINGVEILETDYEILNSWEVFIKNHSIPGDDEIILVEFESGFDEIPQKFLWDIFTLVISEYIESLKKSEQVEQSGKNVISEELWPRSVRYELSGNANDVNSVNSARKCLKSACIPPHLRVF